MEILQHEQEGHLWQQDSSWHYSVPAGSQSLEKRPGKTPWECCWEKATSNSLMLTAPVAKIDASSTPTPGREHSKKAFGYTAISPYKDLLLYTELQLLDIYVNVKNNFVGKWKGMALSGP